MVAAIPLFHVARLPSICDVEQGPSTGASQLVIYRAYGSSRQASGEGRGPGGPHSFSVSILSVPFCLA